MAELKKDTLAAFKKWQTHVMRKLNEITVVVNSNPTQQRQSGPSRGGALNQRGNHHGKSSMHLCLLRPQVIFVILQGFNAHPTRSSLCLR